VLTGGPCGGKTTAQVTLSNIFESMGWRVFRVPETATVLLGGGISFNLLDDEQRLEFQENLLRTMFQIEDTYFSLATTQNRNCLVICDRGAMDCSAYLPKADWEGILEKNLLDEVDIRDNRYDQVVHLVSAAIGAEEHYTRSNNKTRTEDIELARSTDRLVGEAWVGHPYYELIDNSTDFETKMRRLCRAVTARLQIPHAEELLHSDSVKRKFLVECEALEPTKEQPWPRFRDFQVFLPPSREHAEPAATRCSTTTCPASPGARRPGSGAGAAMVRGESSREALGTGAFRPSQCPPQVNGCTRTRCGGRWRERWWRPGLTSPARSMTSCWPR
jgi:hypothetical protein